MKFNWTPALIAATVFGLITIGGDLALTMLHIPAGSFITTAGTVLTLLSGLFGLNTQNLTIQTKVNGTLQKLADVAIGNATTPVQVQDAQSAANDAGVTPSVEPGSAVTGSGPEPVPHV